MIEFNVYEQRFPTNGGKDAKGGQVWWPNLVLLGLVRAVNAKQAIESARERYRVRHPMVHELDERGNEKFYSGGSRG